MPELGRAAPGRVGQDARFVSAVFQFGQRRQHVVVAAGAFKRRLHEDATEFRDIHLADAQLENPPQPSGEGVYPPVRRFAPFEQNALVQAGFVEVYADTPKIISAAVDGLGQHGGPLLAGIVRNQRIAQVE